MPRLVLPLLAAAAVAASASAFAPGHGHPPGFRLPDASAACRLEDGQLVCRSLAVRSGLALGVHGAPRRVTAPVWWDASTPVLERWAGDGLRCRDAGGAIVCTNASGVTVSLGPRQVAVAL